jgi:hypothetical protein
MPRGTCENCDEHDAFVYSSPLAFGRNVFVCIRCLAFPDECEEDENDEIRACSKQHAPRGEAGK